MLRRHLLCAPAGALTPFALALTACGGGEDTRTEGLGQAERGYFEGRLVDSTGAPVTDAEVWVPSPSGPYTRRTDGDGRYTMSVALSDFAGMLRFVLRAFKTGFQPFFAEWVGAMQGATTYRLGGGANVMARLAANEHSTVDYAQVIHLGDSSFSGSANSQLQTATQGVRWRARVLDWSSAMDGRFRTAAVRLMMRGLQGNNNPGGFVALVDGGNSVVGQPYNLAFDTYADGSYQVLFFTTQLPAALVAGPLSVFVQAGSKPGDVDDFEYTGVSVQLA